MVYSHWFSRWLLTPDVYLPSNVIRGRQRIKSTFLVGFGQNPYCSGQPHPSDPVGPQLGTRRVEDQNWRLRLYLPSVTFACEIDYHFPKFCPVFAFCQLEKYPCILDANPFLIFLSQDIQILPKPRLPFIFVFELFLGVVCISTSCFSLV